MARSYFSSKLEGRYLPEIQGYGVFARALILKGELLCLWGGNIWTTSEFEQLPVENRSHGLQVDENLFQTYGPQEIVEPADYVNHSCNPNAGLQGPISLIAMRDIHHDEEICFDYAMSDGSPYDEFNCQCGSANCRGTVTGNDWMIPELQHVYLGYFSPYLQKRIHKQQLNLRKTEQVHGLSFK